MITPNLGRAIKVERTRLGDSQEEFALRCDISRPTLIHAEAGQASKRTLEKISRVTGYVFAELLPDIPRAAEQPQQNE